MNQTAIDRVHRSKVETLMGERGDRKDHAVRFRDLQALGLNVTASGQVTSFSTGANPVGLMAVALDDPAPMMMRVSVEDQTLELNDGFEALRTERNRRLALCDWTQMPDVPLSETQRALWRAYRSALRDLPANISDPLAPVWPIPPATTPEQI